MLPFVLTGHYLNVNSIEDLNVANFLARALHFETHRVSIVIPAYNEAASIRHVVRDFRPHVHEVVVMRHDVARCTPPTVEQIWSSRRSIQRALAKAEAAAKLLIELRDLQVETRHGAPRYVVSPAALTPQFMP